VKGATLLDFADDAAAGVAYLRSRPDIAPKKIGLIGHSQGGMTAPLFAYDPQKTLAQVTCPVLALDGGLDLQVPAKENIAALKAGLSGDHDVTIEELPGLNHLFQAAKTGAPSEYAEITQTFDPAALLLMTDWVVKETR
jgi:dienelactone hydrolase